MKLPAYDTIERCAYCGDPRRDRIGCCGENHWEMVPECPRCGEDLHPSQGIVMGIETYWMQCFNCDYRTDFE